MTCRRKGTDALCPLLQMGMRPAAVDAYALQASVLASTTPDESSAKAESGHQIASQIVAEFDDERYKQAYQKTFIDAAVEGDPHFPWLRRSFGSLFF